MLRRHETFFYETASKDSANSLDEQGGRIESVNPGVDAPTAPPSPSPVHRLGMLRRHETFYYESAAKDSANGLDEQGDRTESDDPEGVEAPTAPPSPSPVHRPGMLRRQEAFYYEPASKDSLQEQGDCMESDGFSVEKYLEGKVSNDLLEGLEKCGEEVLLQNPYTGIPEGPSREYFVEQRIVILEVSPLADSS
ncbi:hypothetical protein FB446DRAFT_794718 [Lentinula raphanica]|nr:hypothetical protein FB446DRAFT_794718 [Lentinula raphanica]